MTLETDITSLVANVGFPIAITFWFMFRTESVIKSNTEMMQGVKDVITNCRGKPPVA